MALGAAGIGGLAKNMMDSTLQRNVWIPKAQSAPAGPPPQMVGSSDDPGAPGAIVPETAATVEKPPMSPGHNLVARLHTHFMNNNLDYANRYANGDF